MNPIKTGKNYYDTLKGMTKNTRMTSAKEELKIALSCKTQEDIKRKYLMPDGSWIWLWTSTALRKPKNNNPIVKNGRKYWKRILVEGEKEVKTILIPESGIVKVWDKSTGLPKETELQNEQNIKAIHTHFWFNENMDEVAVGRGCDWHLDEGEWCLGVDARYDRPNASSADCFRPVRGSIKAEKHKHKFTCECGETRRFVVYRGHGKNESGHGRSVIGRV